MLTLPEQKRSPKRRGQPLQDAFLEALRKDLVPISIFLVNGIKLRGVIESFDQFSIMLKSTTSQVIYKHAISTVVSARDMRLSFEDSTAEGH